MKLPLIVFLFSLFSLAGCTTTQYYQHVDPNYTGDLQEDYSFCDDIAFGNAPIAPQYTHTEIYSPTSGTITSPSGGYYMYQENYNYAQAAQANINNFNNGMDNLNAVLIRNAQINRLRSACLRRLGWKEVPAPKKK